MLITINSMVKVTNIEQLTVVVNYDLPINLKGRVDFETYLNRISRTGRFGKSGLAINCMDRHRSFSHLQKLRAILSFWQKIVTTDSRFGRNQKSC